MADTWLRQNIDPYVQWARTHNSLLILTGDEGDRAHNFSGGITTVITGDPRLFVSGKNTNYISHYNVLRTIEDMYGLPLLGNTATANPLRTNGLGQLTPTSAAVKSTVAIGSSSPSSVFGQGVSFTATVSGSSSTVPTGSVTFTDGTTVLGTVTLNASAQATLSTAALSVGTHSITASYGGDANFTSSVSSSISVMVSKASSAAAITSSANPIAVGTRITLSATLSAVSPGAGTPSGTVTFKDGTTTLGSATLASGVAALSNVALVAGAHSITAVYGGDSRFLGVSSPALIEQVSGSITGPANDNFLSAAVIAGTALTLTGSNVGATKEVGEPNHAWNTGGKSVWWSWTAPASGTCVIDTATSSFDTLLACYTGSSVSALTQVVNGANDDTQINGTWSITSKITISVVAGTTYRIAVDGFNGASGSVVLHVNLAASKSSRSDTTVPAGNYLSLNDRDQLIA
jgi:hypothetical protein